MSADAPTPQGGDVKLLFQAVRRLETAVGETRDLVAGTGKEPGLAEMVRGLVRTMADATARLEGIEDRQAEQAREIEALKRDPDARIAGAVRALWVPLAAAGLIAIVGAAALGVSIRMAAAAQAHPPPNAPIASPKP